MTHFRRVCSCGVVLAQCRCPGEPKAVDVVKDGCEACQARSAPVDLPAAFPHVVPVVPPTKQEPTAVLAPCPDCGRSKGRNLTLEEAYRVFGYAKSDCLACQLTDIGRGVLA